MTLLVLQMMLIVADGVTATAGAASAARLVIDDSAGMIELEVAAH
jgi:hypothetical protein